mmetsp:Transcript_17249/g.33852  ORF Transcript_17249/g.33852 Transcript_17249/m.33852 type:complete len:712 (+) Transcript_17249:124-2259(+)|eukprot:CAMPEP_0173386326 /NCGR_PEP_ID=MMETSP1356-20130122/8921_1 /TAXON_ID=77927 ORGANISM="Hemiselmis virescens, Strain PCC157" /NCGR_SAMPLE_ID=MMETSP1356 /ASSEMBLY_ACC=CAM_ASM_000847 /LENGTH=711 /DNA_ID=CAMNT_0014342511 /DNA_START=26 /DNA_END=2161 /DNA_ORIENTATION=+
MFKFLQKGVTDPSKNYIAAPKDNSLGSLLHEAFKCLEMRFANFDHDNAETLMYKELERELSSMGFRHGEGLAQMFKTVDFDGNGTLDFGEFLALLYLWAVRGGGDYSVFFRHPTNAAVIKQAFDAMEQCMRAYDTDGSRKLEIKELENFFNQQLPKAVQCGAYKSAVDEVFPPAEWQAGKELSFPRLMVLLYKVTCRMPGSTVKGRYDKKDLDKVNPFADGTGSKSNLWQELSAAFKVLEDDFCRFDKNGDQMVDFTEITMGIPATFSNAARFEILTRLEYAFGQVDIDQSRTLDFFEYMYLGFMMTQSGSYRDLVHESQGTSVVKCCFIDIHTNYRKYDADGNMRLTWDEIQKFSVDLFGEVAPGLEDAFKKVCYKSKATQNRDCVDIVRMMKMLYSLICPDGRFHPSKYDAIIAKKVSKPQDVVSSHVAPPATTRPKRFTNVQVSKFKKGKLLGQGGQGCVCLGSYDGVECAGKTFLGAPDQRLVQDTLDEVKFFMMLDHPNMHYLLGAKTSLDNGGIIVLTELCDNGSIFDLYSKKYKRFDNPTAWRWARECAVGLEEMHKLGYMHRDLKSLNVFLDKNFVAKVADFGMATPAKTSTEACGTGHWAAPEVASCCLGRPMAYGPKCDIYSYGIMVWEFFHSKIPYGNTNLDQMGIMNAVLTKGMRPQMSSSCPPEVVKFIMGCLNADPNRRPPFKDIIGQLDSIRNTFK